MGAYKTALFEDKIKDKIGELFVCNLGVDSKIYEKPTNIFLLQKQDFQTPF